MSYTYDAFISYSRRNKPSENLVPRLHRALESYIIPKIIDTEDLRDRERRKAMVFRDKTGLELSGDLNQLLKDKIAASLWLIVVCSHEAISSDWCRKEIDKSTESRRGKESSPS
jgi:hypothetical protein